MQAATENSTNISPSLVTRMFVKFRHFECLIQEAKIFLFFERLAQSVVF